MKKIFAFIIMAIFLLSTVSAQNQLSATQTKARIDTAVEKCIKTGIEEDVCKENIKEKRVEVAKEVRTTLERCKEDGTDAKDCIKASDLTRKQLAVAKTVNSRELLVKHKELREKEDYKKYKKKAFKARTIAKEKIAKAKEKYTKLKTKV